MLDVLIHHIVHLTYFDYTLPVLQNFEKTMWVQKTWIESIVKELKKKRQKFHFSKLELILSVCMQSSALIRLRNFSQCCGLCSKEIWKKFWRKVGTPIHRRGLGPYRPTILWKDSETHHWKHNIGHPVGGWSVWVLRIFGQIWGQNQKKDLNSTELSKRNTYFVACFNSEYCI